MRDTLSANELAGVDLASLLDEVHEDATRTARTVEEGQAKAQTRIWDAQIDRPYARQGDLYIQRLPVDQEFDRPLARATSRQLAPGKSQGSRHVLDDGPDILFFQDAQPLEGPIIRAPHGFYLRHPTHGDIDCRLPGTYRVTYPLDQAAAEREEIRRLRD